MGTTRAPEPLTFGYVSGWLAEGCEVEVVAVELSLLGTDGAEEVEGVSKLWAT